ncbi:MAG: ABC transporter permease [Deltaproteobacteria bacterium]|nr:ABC transporter permease [Deltaproteobacteria bacterium]
MSPIAEGLAQAFSLIVRGDPGLLRVIWLSLWATGIATTVAMVVGVPTGVFLALRRFPGRNLFVTFVNAGMGIPPVVVGLLVFLLLARSGPLGGLDLLYTPTAIIVAQVIIATPQVIGVTIAGIQGLDERLVLQIVSLGAGRAQLYLKLVREARVAVLAALAAGFGAIISEVGAVMMVGGNIQGQTRVMTSAIVLETRQGNFAMAIALSIVLLVIALVINGAFTWLQQRRPR